MLCITGTVDIWHLFRHAQASAMNAVARNPPNKGKETRTLAHVLCLFHLKKNFDHSMRLGLITEHSCCPWGVSHKSPYINLRENIGFNISDPPRMLSQFYRFY